VDVNGCDGRIEDDEDDDVVNRRSCDDKFVVMIDR
jgi:hypothetical protein